MKRHMIVLLTAFLLLVGGMLLPAAKVEVQAAARLNYTSLTVKQGTTKKLKVKGTSAKVTWSSSNENVATVNSNGKITTIKGGNAVITAQTKNKVFRCKVYVVGFNKTSLTIAKGSTYTLKVKNGGTSKVWSSSDTSIATVSSTGKIKAKKKGEVTITCRTRKRTIKCKVYVAKLNTTSVALTVGATKQLKVSNTGSTIKWSSSNPTVASVDENGLVTAGVESGTATITCKTGQAVLTCNVRVGIITPMSTLPTSSNVSRLDVTVESYPGTKTYTVYHQSSSENKNDGSVISTTYMPNHGCAACAASTVLSAYAGMSNGPVYFTEVIEKNLFGTSWTTNYSKSDSDQRPISLYGITKVLDYYNVSNKYVRSYSDASAINDITNHLKTGNAVIIEVKRLKNDDGTYDTTWSNSYHTMVLLGITDTGKVIVADSANRSGFGDTQRIKYTTVAELIPYMYSCTSSSTSAYFSSSSGGGYILVNPQD